jgi:hypothetical protein
MNKTTPITKEYIKHLIETDEDVDHLTAEDLKVAKIFMDELRKEEEALFTELQSFEGIKVGDRVRVKTGNKQGDKFFRGAHLITKILSRQDLGTVYLCSRKFELEFKDFTLIKKIS